MNRRGFIGALLAPFVAKRAPSITLKTGAEFAKSGAVIGRPVTASVFAEVEAKMLNAQMQYADWLATSMYVHMRRPGRVILTNIQPATLPDYAKRWCDEAESEYANL